MRKEARLLAQFAVERMHRVRVCTPVHHQAEIAEASSGREYVFKRCVPFLRAKSVCPQKRPPRTGTRRTHVCVQASTGQNGLVRAARERERPRGRGSGRDSMRQKDGVAGYKFVSQQSGSCTTTNHHYHSRHRHDHVHTPVFES